MPGTWKKGKISGISRFVAGLRSRKGAGDNHHPSSLVVQPGFPTSIADIVVKNSGRLRKNSPPRSSAASPPSASTSWSGSSSKKKPPQPQLPPRNPSPARLSSAAASPIHPLLLTEPDAPEDPLQREVSGIERAASQDKIDLFSTCSSPNMEFSSLPSASPYRDFPTTSATCGVGSPPGEESIEENSISIADTDVNGRNKDYSARVGFQARIVLLLILAVCTKEVVIGIMISAFLLLFFEAVGCRLINWMRSRDGNGDTNAATPDPGSSFIESLSRNHSATDVRSSVSFSSRMDGSWDSTDPFLEMLVSPPIGTERDEEFAASGRKSTVSVSEAEIEPTKSEKKKKKKKKKKFWSKVVKEKFRKGKKGKKEADSGLSTESISDIRSGVGSPGVASPETSDTDDNEEEDDIDDVGAGLNNGDEILRSGNVEQSVGVGITAWADKGDVVTKATSISLVLMVVVLSGLIGGRFVALALTVPCCFLLKLAGSLKRKQKTQ